MKLLFQSIRRDNIKLKDIKKDYRPRERLISLGASNLTDEELLACILKDGTRNLNVKELSNIILNKVNSIKDLRYITLEDLVKIKGIGVSKATSLLASIELGLRISSDVNTIDNLKFENTKMVYEYYKNKIGYLEQETFSCVYLNPNNVIIKEKLLFKGTLNYSIVHPREVFKEAFNIGATSIICIHNHPSGSIKPSKEDLLLTKRLIEVGNIMGIKIIDHLIISKDKYYSFFENGNI